MQAILRKFCTKGWGTKVTGIRDRENRNRLFRPAGKMPGNPAQCREARVPISILRPWGCFRPGPVFGSLWQRAPEEDEEEVSIPAQSGGWRFPASRMVLLEPVIPSGFGLNVRRWGRGKRRLGGIVLLCVFSLFTHY